MSVKKDPKERKKEGGDKNSRKDAKAQREDGEK
jgi:hypothetical protein